MKELAFSHCWKAECLPAAFSGKAYNLTITEVTKHNVATMPAASYQLITLVAPFGMGINVTLNPAGGAPVTYSSAVGAVVSGGRMQVVPIPPPGLSSITIK